MITVLIWINFVNAEHDLEESKFQSHSNLLQQSVVDRIKQYEQILYGAKGLFLSSVNVEYDEWKSFVTTQEISERFEGIQGVGYIKHISNDTELTALAYALSQNSEHPLAKAVLNYAQAKQAELREASEFSVVAGKGVKAMVGQRDVLLGSGNWMRELGLLLPVEQIQIQGASVSWLAEMRADKAELIGLLCFADKAKAEAKAAVEKAAAEKAEKEAAEQAELEKKQAEVEAAHKEA